MSDVTNLVFVTNLCDDGNLPLIDSWLRAKSSAWWLGRELGENDDAGGNKALEVNLHACALNGFRAKDEFMAYLRTLDWATGQPSILIVAPQEDAVEVVELRTARRRERAI